MQFRLLYNTLPVKQCKKILAAVLAAGSSSRMGASKLTMPFAGTTLLDIALSAAIDSKVAAVVGVTGGHRDETSAIMRKYPAIAEANNPHYLEGQSTSVRCAVEYAVLNGYDALLVMVADQPFVRSNDLDRLISASCKSKAIAFVTESGKRSGNPCLFTSACFADLCALEGDQGARAAFPLWKAAGIERVQSGNAFVHEDADTPESFAELESLYCEHIGRR